MKNQHLSRELCKVDLKLRSVFFILFTMFGLTPIAFSQVTQYPVPKPNPDYQILSGQVEEDLLFVRYFEEKRKLYVYEFKNNNWGAKGEISLSNNGISTNHYPYDISVSNNMVALVHSAPNFISVYDYQNDEWIETDSISPPEEYEFMNVAIQDNRIVADLHTCAEFSYVCGAIEHFVNIYDYNGTNWVNTVGLPHIVFSLLDEYADEFTYYLGFSGKHIAVTEQEANYVRIYTLRNGNWEQSGLLSNNSDYKNNDFARAIDLDGNRLAINTGKGYAMIYEYEGSSWVKKAELKPQQSSSVGPFVYGFQISVSGNLVAFNASRVYNDYPISNGVVFEYKDGQWMEELSITSDGSDRGVDLTLSGKNLFITDNATPRLYRIESFLHPGFSNIQASDGKEDSEFGRALDVDKNLAVVGAPFDSEKGDGAGAVYFYQSAGNTWDEIIKATASDAHAGDRFGVSVAISENYAVVGAPMNDDAGKESGAAYLFELVGNQWIERAKLTAPGAAPKDRFGASVAINAAAAAVGEQESRDILIVVGAPYADYDGHSGAGAVHLFFYDDYWRTVSHRATLIPDNPKNGDQFGKSVDISYGINYSKVVVGAPYKNDPVHGKDAGAVYIFEDPDKSKWSDWVQTAKLTASDGKENDRFGSSVAISWIIAVGAPLSDDDGIESGSAYLYENGFYDENGNYTYDWRETKITASDANARDRFGSSVNMYGRQAVVGASYADHRGGTNAGAAYSYISNNQDRQNWVETGKYTGNARTGDRLGFAVSINADQVFAGAYHDNTINGDNAGSAYAFDLIPLSNTAVIASRTNEKVVGKEIKKEVIQKPITGIKELIIYPNPFAQQLQLQLDQENAEPVEITLMDQLGRKLYQHRFSAPEIEQQLDIDLTHTKKPIPAGIIFLGLKTSQGNSKWIRLIKK